MSTSEKTDVHTFTAASLGEALAQVRTTLGPEALIMGQQSAGHRVSVQACLELPVCDQVRSKERSKEPDDDLVVSERGIPTPLDEQVLGIFTEVGYGSSVIADMPGSDNLAELRHRVVQRLNYAHKPISSLHGHYRVVGAAGVGKSTTLIKVLVEWVLRNGARGVAVISTDNERLAGTESLQLTCQMLNVPMRECSPADLAQVLGSHRREHLVLVDSAAMELRKPMVSVTGLLDLWVCSALHGPAHLRAQHGTVLGVNPVGVVVTQLDQIAAPDPVVNLLYQWRLPLYWLGTGNHLPEGIELAHEASVYESLFGASKRNARELEKTWAV